MYEEEEEVSITTKIIIPKFRILHCDLEVEKKDPNATDNLSGVSRSDRQEKSNKKDEKNMMEKILERNKIYRNIK